MTTFRVFTNDVDNGRGYSAFGQVKALTLAAARVKARAMVPFGCKVLVIANAEKDLWPDSQTGQVDAALLRERGNFARFA